MGTLQYVLRKAFEIIKMGYFERVNVIDYVAKACERSNSLKTLRVNGKNRSYKKRNKLNALVLW